MVIGSLILLSAIAALAYEKIPQGIMIPLPAARATGVEALKVTVVTADIIHVLGLPPANAPEPVSLMIDGRSLPSAEFTVEQDRDRIHLATNRLNLWIDARVGRITFKDCNDTLLLEEGARELQPVTVCGEEVHQVRQSFAWQTGEALYGLGQHQQGIFNWRGHYVELVQYNKRAVVPFLLSTRGYGLLWDNYAYTKFDDTGVDPYLWSEVGDAVNYYFIYGPDSDRVIRHYRELTGPAPLFPKWAYGYIQSKERYHSQAEILEVAREYRDRKIPMDVMVLDWRYWDDGFWGQKSFNKERFPAPDAMMRTLHEDLNTHLMISVWPKMSNRTPNYQEMLKTPGFLYADADSNDWFYDAFNPQARALYWRQANEGLFSHGIDAWWCDATEPEVDGWDFNIDAYKNKMKPMIGSGARYMNAYSLMHAKGVYENQRRTTEDKRVVNLTRSAFAGQQRYATITWSGDIVAQWDVFRAQIPAGLNFCMSGLPYWTMDIGGFFVQSAQVGALGRGMWFREGGFDDGIADDNYKELYVRWFQFGAFCPIFRSHGTDISREIWRFGEPGQWAYDALVKFDTLRYRLMPYIYAQAWQVTHNGGTLMRGLPMDFPHDPHVFGIGDQFMFGPALMVCPVTHAKAAFRPVYLPQGCDWFNFWTGKQYSGGQTLQVPAPIDEIPLFVRAGSMLPMGPVIQYASESADPLELRIYPGADGRFILYDDEGDNYHYEEGRYSTVTCRWDDTRKTMTLDAVQGDFPGRAASRQVRLVLVGKGRGVGVGEIQDPDQVIQYHGDSRSVSLR